MEATEIAVAAAVFVGGMVAGIFYWDWLNNRWAKWDWECPLFGCGFHARSISPEVIEVVRAHHMEQHQGEGDMG